MRCGVLVGLVFALLPLEVDAATDDDRRSLARSYPWRLQSAGRSGLYGWGLGLELPMVGVMTGIGGRSEVGWGYNLGGALSWEVTPHWVLRLFVMGGESHGGRAALGFQDGNTRQRAQQPARWVGLETGLGVAYQFIDPRSPFTPYVGFDAGVRTGGYIYNLEGELVTLKVPEAEDPDEVVITDAFDLGFMGGLRLGVRMDLKHWLATLTELHVAYTYIGDEPVANTLIQREVSRFPDALWLVRMVFTVRVGL